MVVKNTMSKIQLTVHHKAGLHARPASLFVQNAKRFDADIKVIYENDQANAKSILEVLALGAGQGAEITIQSEGIDSDEALDSLKTLIENNFKVEE